jgi:hypothetical protein
MTNINVLQTSTEESTSPTALSSEVPYDPLFIWQGGKILINNAYR